ncbi:hypothetical protein JN11_04392 [Mucilaginibacter frigoritolerans]|uniref:Uncharacterized protein n=1 Tax=Mucilaginibacter frigoritolerans TaxID=652788 RepID=A0A562TPW8_9SPHI|nr:hypothetical protein JN11_04392 [Mucilaginibacter frigoritolerans]
MGTDLYAPNDTVLLLEIGKEIRGDFKVFHMLLAKKARKILLSIFNLLMLNEKSIFVSKKLT